MDIRKNKKKKFYQVIILFIIIFFQISLVYSESTLISNISIIKDGDFTSDRFDFENGIVVDEYIAKEKGIINYDLYFEACSNKACISIINGLVEVGTNFAQIKSAPLDGYQKFLRCELNKVYCCKTRNGLYVKFTILELNTTNNRIGSMILKWVCQKNGMKVF